jgi:hypothetical protein
MAHSICGEANADRSSSIEGSLSEADQMVAKGKRTMSEESIARVEAFPLRYAETNNNGKINFNVGYQF